MNWLLVILIYVYFCYPLSQDEADVLTNEKFVKRQPHFCPSIHFRKSGFKKLIRKVMKATAGLIYINTNTLPLSVGVMVLSSLHVLWT